MKTLVLLGLCVCVIVCNQQAHAARNEVCCGADLGCFNSGGVFTDFPNRPLASLPDCDLVSKFRLHVNSRENPVVTQIVDPYDVQTITASSFSLDRETKILIHGFTDRFSWPWWTDLIAALLEDGDYNIVRLDWSAGNVPPYLQATANTRIAGAFVAKLCNTLKNELNYSPSKIHIIGHSLGAHIAGYAGERVDKISRISGIDPAGLYFSNMDPVVRLDPTDAEKVDTLIADGEPILSLGFGSLQAMGHLNFYVNGGNKQPGCSAFLSLTGGPSSFNDTNFDWLSSGVQTFYQTIGCNHWRALSLYTETVGRHKCVAKAFQCDTYQKYLSGECFSCQNGGCTSLGYQVDTALIESNQVKNFYLATTDRPPFCVQTFRLVLKLQEKTSINDAREERGKIFITVLGTLGSSSKTALTEDNVDLVPGSVNSFLFTVPRELGQVRDVAISWEARSSVLNPLEWWRTRYIHVSGNLELQDQNQQVTFLKPVNDKIEEEKEVLAVAVTISRRARLSRRF